MSIAYWTDHVITTAKVVRSEKCSYLTISFQCLYQPLILLGTHNYLCWIYLLHNWQGYRHDYVITLLHDNNQWCQKWQVFLTNHKFAISLSASHLAWNSQLSVLDYWQEYRLDYVITLLHDNCQRCQKWEVFLTDHKFSISLSASHLAWNSQLSVLDYWQEYRLDYVITLLHDNCQRCQKWEVFLTYHKFSMSVSASHLAWNSQLSVLDYWQEYRLDYVITLLHDNRQRCQKWEVFLTYHKFSISLSASHLAWNSQISVLDYWQEYRLDYVITLLHDNRQRCQKWEVFLTYHMFSMSLSASHLA